MSGHDVVVRFFHDIDRQDWPAVRAALSDTVSTDYSSLFGGDPEELLADDLVSRWHSLLPGFDATQHLLGPLVPTDDTAAATEELTLECNVRAHHRLGGTDSSADEWLVAGRYTIQVRRSDRGWAVSGITLHTTYQAGDPALADIAAQRSQRRPS